MHPVLHVPLLGTVQSHDVMVSVAAVVAACLGFYWAVRTEHLSSRRVSAALVLIALATFAGGRGHFVLANWGRFAAEPGRLLNLSSSALHAPGALLGAAAGSALAAWLLKISIARLADALAPAVAIGIAVARVGCLLHGCCYGVYCSQPWGVSLPADSYVYLRQLEDGFYRQGRPTRFRCIRYRSILSSPVSVSRYSCSGCGRERTTTVSWRCCSCFSSASPPPFSNRCAPTTRCGSTGGRCPSSCG
jgi:phosphatidylglycerol:prolipoprotein diacylglycerol transferase